MDYVVLSNEPIVLAVLVNHPIAREYNLSQNAPMTPYYLPPEQVNRQNMMTLVQEQGMDRVAWQILNCYNAHPNIVMTLKNSTIAIHMASAGLEMVFALVDSVARTDLLKPMAWFTIDNLVLSTTH